MAGEWVEGEGPDRCRLMIVGEAPAKEEMKQGRPLVGMTGKETMNFLKRYIGLNREDVYLTNFCKRFMPENDKTIPKSEYEMWGEILEEEIGRVQPDTVLSLGALSSHYFLGNMDMEQISGVPHRRGSIIVVPSFHPAACFREAERYQWVREAFEATKRMMDGRGREWEESEPTTIVDISEMEDGGRWAVDTETYADGRPYMITATNREQRACYAYCDDYMQMRRIGEKLASADGAPLLHNALFDVPVLRQAGVRLREWICTMQMAFLLQSLPIGLKPLSYRLAGMRQREYEDVVGDRVDLSQVPEDERLAYACADPDATLRVYNRMRRRVYDGMEPVLQRDIGIMPMIMRMMQRGMRVETEVLKEQEEWLIAMNEGLLANIRNIGGHKFDPKSSQQCGELLFGKLHLGEGVRLKKTKSGLYSTDAKALAKVKRQHKVVGMIEEYRQRKDLLNKYIEVIPRMVKSDGRIHPNINLTRVKHSGRLATPAARRARKSSANLLAMPIRTEDGARIRQAFVATPGFKLVSFDYSQIEMRVLAHISMDQALLDAFEKDIDVHADTAARMFKIKMEEVTKKQRDPAKNTGFGVVYRISPRGLYEQFQKVGLYGYTESQCGMFIKGWYEIHPGVREYQMQTDAEVRRTQQIRDLFGRMTYMTGIHSCHERIREEVLRKAGNQPIQGTAQGIIKEAMVRLTTRVERWGMDDLCYPLMQIHDDLMWECREEFVEEMIGEVMTIMEKAVELIVPVKVECKVGIRWGRMEKYTGRV